METKLSKLQKQILKSLPQDGSCADWRKRESFRKTEPTKKKRTAKVPWHVPASTRFRRFSDSEKVAVSKSLTRLEKRGLIEKYNFQELLLVNLTEKGKETANELRRL